MLRAEIQNNYIVINNGIRLVIGTRLNYSVKKQALCHKVTLARLFQTCLLSKT